MELGPQVHLSPDTYAAKDKKGGCFQERVLAFVYFKRSLLEHVSVDWSCAEPRMAAGLILTEL
jgi:hypothetical protein